MIAGHRLEEPVSFPKSDDEWHSFWYPNSHWVGREVAFDRVEASLQLKRYMDGLHKSLATFKPSDAFDDGRGFMSSVPEELLHLLGTWRTPSNIYADSQEANRKFVNPNYIHSHHYADVAVRCGCGAAIFRESFGEDQPQPSHQQEHGPDCHKIHRHESRLQLLKNRRETIIEMALLGKNFRAMANRLGYTGSKDIVPTVANAVGLDTEELLREGRRRVARTFMVLLREYSPKIVAEIYDVTPRTVSDVVRQETVADPGALFRVRRRNGDTGGIQEVGANV